MTSQLDIIGLQASILYVVLLTLSLLFPKSLRQLRARRQLWPPPQRPRTTTSGCLRWTA